SGATCTRSVLFGHRRAPLCSSLRLPRAGCFWGRFTHMKKLSLPVLGGLLLLAGASLIGTPAHARTDCTFERWTNNPITERPIFSCQERVAKRTKRSQYAKRKGGQRTARVNRKGAWQGWAGSFHLDGARYPGGTRAGPATY